MRNEAKILAHIIDRVGRGILLCNYELLHGAASKSTS